MASPDYRPPLKSSGVVISIIINPDDVPDDFNDTDEDSSINKKSLMPSALTSKGKWTSKNSSVIDDAAANKE